tara:strand:+ start:12 stop:215 length:204 start_codon:yes stop_codon:yes gene_type:complete
LRFNADYQTRVLLKKFWGKTFRFKKSNDGIDCWDFLKVGDATTLVDQLRLTRFRAKKNCDNFIPADA